MHMYIVTLHNSAQAVDTQRQPKYFLHLFIFYQFLENIIQCVLIMLIFSLSSSQPPDCVLLFFFFFY